MFYLDTISTSKLNIISVVSDTYYLPTVRVERRVPNQGGLDALQSGLRVDNAKPSIPPTLGARSVLNTETFQGFACRTR